MPSDASCKDIEIDQSLPFLNNYVQESLEKGAQPCIDHLRGGQDHHEGMIHALKFEAYKLPTPAAGPLTVSQVLYPSEDERVPSYPRELDQAISMSFVQESSSSVIKLRLDGVQKKWSRPTYSNPRHQNQL